MNLKFHHPEESFHLYRIRENTQVLDSLLMGGRSVLSDAYSPKALSRSSLVEPSSETLSAYDACSVDTMQYDLGELVISRISDDE